MLTPSEPHSAGNGPVKREGNTRLVLITAILTLTTAIFGCLSAFLGLKTSELSDQRNNAQAVATSARSTVVSLRTNNSALQVSNSALASATQSLRSQLALPSATALTPSAVVVRHSATSLVLALDGEGANLDAPQSDGQWGRNADKTDVDITYGAGELGFGGRDALILGAGIPASYSSCSTETGYSGADVQLEDIQVGQGICVKTDGNRYAALKVRQAVTARIVFDVVTYDPPFNG